MDLDSNEVAQARDPRRRRLERRSEVRRNKVLRDHPETGPAILAMSDEPTAHTAFDLGDPWERWVAEIVRETFPEGVFLFHRNRSPGYPGDIDIVAVLGTGVWAIDIVRFDGATVETRSGTGVDGRHDALYIGDDDRTGLLDDVDAQAEAVSAALLRAGFPSLRTNGVLCLVDVVDTWHGHLTVGATHVTKARPMLKVLSSGPTILDGTDIASLGLSLDQELSRQHPGGSPVDADRTR